MCRRLLCRRGCLVFSLVAGGLDGRGSDADAVAVGGVVGGLSLHCLRLCLGISC